MSQYVILQDIHGTQQKFLADDDGVIQQSVNGSDQQGLKAEAGSVGPNGVDTAAIQDLAVTTGKLAANAVTNAKQATMATHTFKANITAGTAVPTDITRTELTAELNAATTALQGAASPAQVQRLGYQSPKKGTNLTSGSQTIQPNTDRCSLYVMQDGAMGGVNAIITLGTATATPFSGAEGVFFLDIVRYDTSANTIVIKNNAGADLVTLPSGADGPYKINCYRAAAADWHANGFEWLETP